MNSIARENVPRTDFGHTHTQHTRTVEFPICANMLMKLYVVVEIRMSVCALYMCRVCIANCNVFAMPRRISCAAYICYIIFGCGFSTMCGIVQLMCTRRSCAHALTHTHTRANIPNDVARTPIATKHVHPIPFYCWPDYPHELRSVATSTSTSQPAAAITAPVTIVSIHC